MNRKAQIFETARKTIFWLIIGVVLTAVLMSFAYIIADYKNKLTFVPPELQAELISLRFVNNPDCFALQDEVTERVYSGIIDLAKFTDERLRTCYPLSLQTGHQEQNFRLLLIETERQIQTRDYANRDKFSLDKEVLVNQNGNLHKDRLIIYIQDLEIG
ncbi:hypothetical protein KKA95_02230 [Patescibacteria group bacterium]|nr:hypothetical protein [Patescibacteria group bacterium]